MNPQSNIDMATKISSHSDNPPSALLKPGSKIFWIQYIHHVVDLVSDRGERLFVLKKWRPSKQRWDYKVIMEVEYEYMREWEIKQMRLALEKLGT